MSVEHYIDLPLFLFSAIPVLCCRRAGRERQCARGHHCRETSGLSTACSSPSHSRVKMLIYLQCSCAITVYLEVTQDITMSIFLTKVTLAQALHCKRSIKTAKNLQLSALCRTWNCAEGFMTCDTHLHISLIVKKSFHINFVCPFHT